MSTLCHKWATLLMSSFPIYSASSLFSFSLRSATHSSFVITSFSLSFTFSFWNVKMQVFHLQLILKTMFNVKSMRAKTIYFTTKLFNSFLFMSGSWSFEISTNSAFLKSKAQQSLKLEMINCFSINFTATTQNSSCSDHFDGVSF